MIDKTTNLLARVCWRPTEDGNHLLREIVRAGAEVLMPAGADAVGDPSNGVVLDRVGRFNGYQTLS